MKKLYLCWFIFFLFFAVNIAWAMAINTGSYRISALVSNRQEMYKVNIAFQVDQSGQMTNSEITYPDYSCIGQISGIKFDKKNKEYSWTERIVSGKENCNPSQYVVQLSGETAKKDKRLKIYAIDEGRRYPLNVLSYHYSPLAKDRGKYDNADVDRKQHLQQSAGFKSKCRIVNSRLDSDTKLDFQIDYLWTGVCFDGYAQGYGTMYYYAPADQAKESGKIFHYKAPVANMFLMNGKLVKLYNKKYFSKEALPHYFVTTPEKAKELERLNSCYNWLLPDKSSFSTTNPRFDEDELHFINTYYTYLYENVNNCSMDTTLWNLSSNQGKYKRMYIEIEYAGVVGDAGESFYIESLYPDSEFRAYDNPSTMEYKGFSLGNPRFNRITSADGKCNNGVAAGVWEISANQYTPDTVTFIEGSPAGTVMRSGKLAAYYYKGFFFDSYRKYISFYEKANKIKEGSTLDKITGDFIQNGDLFIADSPEKYEQSEIIFERLLSSEFTLGTKNKKYDVSYGKGLFSYGYDGKIKTNLQLHYTMQPQTVLSVTKDVSAMDVEFTVNINYKKVFWLKGFIGAGEFATKTKRISCRLLRENGFHLKGSNTILDFDSFHDTKHTVQAVRDLDVNIQVKKIRLVR